MITRGEPGLDLQGGSSSYIFKLYYKLNQIEIVKIGDKAKSIKDRSAEG